MKLTHEFDGSVSGPTVVEWGEKVGLVCKMCGVNHLERIIPSMLSGEVFAVYQ